MCTILSFKLFFIAGKVFLHLHALICQMLLSKETYKLDTIYATVHRGEVFDNKKKN